MTASSGSGRSVQISAEVVRLVPGEWIPIIETAVLVLCFAEHDSVLIFWPVCRRSITILRPIDVDDEYHFRLVKEQPDAAVAVLDSVRLGHSVLLQKLTDAVFCLDLLFERCHGGIVIRSAVTEQDGVVKSLCRIATPLQIFWLCGVLGRLAASP